MNLRRSFAFLLVLAAAVPLEAAGQGRSSVRGQIVSRQTLLPVEGASIALRLLAATPDTSVLATLLARSDSTGRFLFERLEAGRYEIAAAHLLDTLPPTMLLLARSERVDVELMVGAADFNAGVTVLPELSTVAAPVPRARSVRDEFEHRRRTGLGQFITREMILARNPPTAMDLLRMASGMEVRCRAGVCLPRVVRSPTNCLPAVSLDGAPADVHVLRGMPPRNIHAIEIYLGLSEAPLELNSGGSRCGLIVIWTRLNSDERRGKQLPDSTTP